MRFVLGLVAGAALALGAVWFLVGRAPCFGRCGAGARCENNRCVPAPPVEASATPAPQKDRRRRHHANSGAAPEVKLQPGDDVMHTQGDALGRPEHIDLSQPDSRELSQEELDAAWRPAQARVEKCIGDAIGDAPLESGRVEVGVRVEASGQIGRVRVEAPQLLLRNGLYKCVKQAAQATRFPAASGASVVTWPFELK